VIVGLDPAPVVTCSAYGGSTMGIEGPIPAAGCRVALQFPGDGRGRPFEPTGDRPHAEAGLTQIGDLDALVLGQVSRADLSDRQAIQWRDEPDLDAVAVGLVTA
jgi:hypothetical protein